MFPAGAPGIALLMLRVSIAAMLLIVAFPGTQIWNMTWQFLVMIALCILLCAGLFTPAACISCVLLAGIRLPLIGDGQMLILILTLVITTSLALLGPGAFSIDARLFGRRIVPATRN